MLIFLFFFALWLLFSGRVTADVIAAGLVLCALVTLFAVKVCGWSTEKSRKCVKLSGKLICYAGCLLAEIIKANIAVLRVITSREGAAMQPQIFRFDSGLHRGFLQTIMANSITITPGTYTIAVDGSVLTVHALNTEFAEGTPGSSLNRRLLEIQETLDRDAAKRQEVEA